MNATSSRVTVRAPDSYRLSGVDGTLNGFIRPHPGFNEVHRFRSSDWGGNHDNSSVIVNCFPFTFVIGETGYGFGFVIRVRRKNNATGASACDVFVDYWNSLTGNWVRGQSIKTGVPLPRDYDRKTGTQMGVSVWGRYVFVYIEDKDSIAFSVDGDSPYAFQLTTNTGPGRVPKLVSPGNAIALGSITALADADRPGNAQVVTTEYKPSETGLLATSPQLAIEDDISTLQPGDYTFAYLLFDGKTGRRSALSDIAQVRSELFDPDGTGPLDSVQLYAAIEITYDSTKYDQAYIYRSVRVQGAGGTYVGTILHLDKIITLEDYLTSNNPLPNPNHKQVVYYYELEDKQLASQQVFPENTLFDENLPKGGACMFYENTMLVAKIKGASVSSQDSNRPTDATRGTGELRWSSLRDVSPELFPPTNVYYPSITTNEIIAFRSVSPNVIGFSSDRQYHIRKEGDYIKVQEVHEGYGLINPQACDTVGSYIYFVSSNGLKAVDVNARLDDVPYVNEFVLDLWKQDYLTLSAAFDPSLACFFLFNRVKEQTLIFWMNTGKVTLLEDLYFHMCCRGVWPDSFVFSKTQLDAGGSANDTYYNTLVERAFFIQNAVKDTASESVSGFEYRVFMVDNRRERFKTAGTKAGYPDRSLLPNSGDAVLTLGANFTSGQNVTINTTGGVSVSGNLWGHYVYVLKSSNSALVGARALIKTTNSGTGVITLSSGTASRLYGLQTGDVIGVAPVKVEWQGAPLPFSTVDDDTQQPVEDFFRVRHLSTIGCSFTDVSAVYDELDDVDLARFEGLAFLGSNLEPTAKAQTRDRSTGTLVQSITDGEGSVYAAFGSETDGGKHGCDGSYLTPGVRIICPDLDFRLVSVRCIGSVRDSTTTVQQ